MTYLRTYASGVAEQTILSWKNDYSSFKKYLMCRIAYNVTLAKMLGDEKINNIYERFFIEGRQEFIDLYNEKVQPEFGEMLNKYEAVHWANG